MLVNRCLKYVAVTIGNILSDLRKDVSKSVAREFNNIKGLEGKKTGDSTWINDIFYNQRVVILIETEIEDSGDKKIYTFITNKRITKEMLTKL